MKDKKWLKEEIKVFQEGENMFTAEFNAGVQQALEYVQELIDQLDEQELTQRQVDKWLDDRDMVAVDTMMVHQTGMQNKVVVEKPVIPQFVADWIERQMKFEYECVFTSMTRLRGNAPEKVKFWFDNNPDMYARAWLDGYEVEKELLWEIPMPDLKTSDGHIQYLTYDPKSKTYFASRKNGRLKQTFNTKDFASVPEQYRHYAELCGFKKIEGVAE